MTRWKLGSRSVTRGSKSCPQGCALYRRSRSCRTYPAASVPHNRNAVLTLHATTPFKELYPHPRQPRRVPEGSRGSAGRRAQRRRPDTPFREPATDPRTALGTPSPARTPIKGGQTHAVPARCPRTAVAAVHRKHYLEPKC